MTWWHYLILVNFYLVLFYGFYVLLLQKETFFQLNRVYLVTASIFSFYIPVIHSNWVTNLFITRRVQYSIYSSPAMIYQFKPIQNTQLNLGQLFVGLYLAGIVFLTLKLVWQLIQLNKILRQNKQTASYSFFKWIKMEENPVDYKIIKAHEQAHARQWHSLDVLIIEVVTIVNWFNPVVYFYRLAIKHIHEYIADKYAIKTGTTKAEYALLLLSKTFDTPAHQLVNPFFNKSLLKRRILMLQKGNSKKVALAKYGLSAPLFILMLIMSSATINNSKAINSINKKAEKVFLTPAADAVTDIAQAEIPDEQPKLIIETKTTKKAGVKKTEYGPMPGEEGSVNQQYVAVERMPEFPGGMRAFLQFIARTINYPVDMRQNNITGKAYVSFVVGKDGAVSDVKLLRDPGYGSGEEAVRAISLSPKWNPGIQNGNAISVKYTVPINFTLAADEDPKPRTFAGVADTLKANTSATQ